MPHVVLLPGGFVISDDRTLLNLEIIYCFLSTESYWAKGHTREQVESMIAHALPLGLYGPTGEQAGFAMVSSAQGAFALLSNVFVLPAWRGNKLGEALVRAALHHPQFAAVDLWLLTTNDAHDFYSKFGFMRAEPSSSIMVLERTHAPAGIDRRAENEL
jgi:ribosomal protein S18 acetylase RimI-like enzyme